MQTVIVFVSPVLFTYEWEYTHLIISIRHASGVYAANYLVTKKCRLLDFYRVFSAHGATLGKRYKTNNRKKAFMAIYYYVHVLY